MRLWQNDMSKNRQEPGNTVDMIRAHETFCQHGENLGGNPQFERRAAPPHRAFRLLFPSTAPASPNHLRVTDSFLSPGVKNAPFFAFKKVRTGLSHTDRLQHGESSLSLAYNVARLPVRLRAADQWDLP